MVNRASLVVVFLAVTAGCQPFAEPHQAPTLWTASYPAKFDNLANCLSAQWVNYATAIPQIYAREQRADVMLKTSAVYLAEYNIRQIDDKTVEVSWRSAAGAPRPFDKDARDRADRCAKTR